MTDRAVVAAIVRRGLGAGRADQDLVAVEAALVVRLQRTGHRNHVDLGILMRTPGDDQDLLTGLLHGEGLVTSTDDVVAVTRDRADDHDVAVVRLAAHVDLDALIRSHALVTSSACGLCGRLEMLAADRRHADQPRATPLSPTVISTLPARLLDGQEVFAQTGGLHAAGLFSPNGDLHLLREDVGRHNAVDKVVGAACRAGSLRAAPHILVVSGRVAFEIVQKAVMAGIDTIVAVGAPSSLAVDAARRTGVTLIGFTRADRFNVYVGDHQVMR